VIHIYIYISHLPRSSQSVLLYAYPIPSIPSPPPISPAQRCRPGKASRRNGLAHELFLCAVRCGAGRLGRAESIASRGNIAASGTFNVLEASRLTLRDAGPIRERGFGRGTRSLGWDRKLEEGEASERGEKGDYRIHRFDSTTAAHRPESGLGEGCDGMDGWMTP
jgi:hypothetical protein